MSQQDKKSMIYSTYIKKKKIQMKCIHWKVFVTLILFKVTTPHSHIRQLEQPLHLQMKLNWAVNEIQYMYTVGSKETFQWGPFDFPVYKIKQEQTSI